MGKPWENGDLYITDGKITMLLMGKLPEGIPLINLNHISKLLLIDPNDIHMGHILIIISYSISDLI